MSIFAVLLRLLPLFASASDQDPSTIEELFSRFEQAGAKTREEVLAALPEEMKRNFVLVSDSHSRQKGTAQLPRVVHFSKNAELVATSSGHLPEDDFAAYDIEVMDLDRTTGAWRMAMIHFDGQKLFRPVYNHRSCLACHGENPRPIWGAYPSWPSAFGGNPELGVETMGAEERAEFLHFAESAPSHEAYRHLRFTVSEKSFALVDTTFELPNSTFTARTAARTAEALALRLAQAPDYARLRLALVGSLRGGCPERPELRDSVRAAYDLRMSADSSFASRWKSLPPQRVDTMLLRLLNLDPRADLRLDRLPRIFDPSHAEDAAYSWSGGSDTLVSMLGFLVLREAALTDPGLHVLVDDAAIERVHARTFTSSVRLRELDQPATRDEYRQSLFPSIEAGILTPALNPAVCERLTRPL